MLLWKIGSFGSCSGFKPGAMVLLAAQVGLASARLLITFQSKCRIRYEIWTINFESFRKNYSAL